MSVQLITLKTATNCTSVAVEGHEPVQLIHSVAVNKTRGGHFMESTGMSKRPSPPPPAEVGGIKYEGKYLTNVTSCAIIKVCR